MKSNQQTSLGIPIAIVLGFTLIAAAIFYSGMYSAKRSTKSLTPTVINKGQIATTSDTVRPIDSTDHIRGNPNAPIMVIEYSDYDCPYCKLFNDTMNQIMTDYGVSGKVAWVYRQFPLAQLHPNAPRLSEAAYCVADLGDNDAFWKFTDEIYNSRDIDSQTDMTQLPHFAETTGVSQTDFSNCLDSGKFKAAVKKSINEGIAAGANGTPYSIVTVGNQQVIINGYKPYTVVKQIIDNLVTQIYGTGTNTVSAGATTTPTTKN